MFSGIVEELGEVARISRRGKLVLLEIAARKISADTLIGDSVSVNGACLTMVKRQEETLSFEVIPETARLTNIGALRIREKVNLERALKVGERICGHFVTGHIDCSGMIRRKGYRNGNLAFEIAIPAQFARLVLPKGSIAVDGISLTVAEKRPCAFSVYIIPHTLKNTTLGCKGPGDKVNLEFDILAKKSLLP